MKKILFTLLAAVLMTGSLMAQNHRICGTMEYLAAQKQADPGLEQRMQDVERDVQQWISTNGNQKTTAVITIPTVVHVLYNNSSQNISDARIIEQIHVLNMDFSRTNADAGNTPSVWQSIASNTQIQFCLAQRDPSGNATTGIVRKSTSTTSFSQNDNVKHNSTGGDDAWPAGSYLNLWVCNLGGGLLGYAQFPGGAASTDGVVVLYSSVGGPAAPGTATPYHLGRTATHEVGHWVNLRHINGDTNCGSDLVSDTPTQDQLHFGCPTHPYHVNVCSGSSNGEMFMNYMDYTDDACMNMFTAGQTSRITATMNGTRASLQSSLGCVPPSGGGCNIPSGLNATSITQTSATLNWTSVSGAASYNVQYRVNGGSTWTSTTSTTNSKAISGLTAGTTYEFQVQTVCSGSNSSFSSSSTFTTSSPACSDNYEPNNSRTAAPTVPTNTTIVGKISPSGDNDYFKFTTVSPNTYIQITLSNLPADYDLKLYNSSGTLLATSQNGGTTNEVIKRNVSTAATYYARVYGYSGANNATICYNLLIATRSTAWRTTSAFEEESDIAEVMNVFPNPVNDKLNVNFNSSAESIFTFRILDLIGKNVMSTSQKGIKGMNTFEINVSQLSKGIYFIEVSNGVERELKKIIVN